MPEIVLVGNGRSLLSREGLGPAIDAFDRVVRFNNFQTEGFETFVGARTDWWARNETPDVAPRKEAFERIILRPRMECADAYAATAQDVQKTVGDTPLDLIPRDLYLDLRERYGYRGAPFTGTLVVAHLLQSHPRVHLCGFDGLEGAEDDLRHYYSEGNVVGDWHTYHEHRLDARYPHHRAAAGRVAYH